MIRRFGYLLVLLILFLGVARLFREIDFWGFIGLSTPTGYVTAGVVFLFTVFVLQLTLFDPYVRIMEERENQTDKKRTLAAEMKEKAEGMWSKYRGAVEDARVEATREREKIGLEAEEEERAELNRARTKVRQQLAKALEGIEIKKAEVRGELKSSIAPLSREIADQVLVKRAAGAARGK